MAGDKDAMKIDTETKAEPTPAPAPVPLTAQQIVQANIALVERAVSTLEPRFTHRALRTHGGLRKKLDSSVLAEIVRAALPKGEWNRVHGDATRRAATLLRSYPRSNCVLQSKLQIYCLLIHNAFHAQWIRFSLSVIPCL